MITNKDIAYLLIAQWLFTKAVFYHHEGKEGNSISCYIMGGVVLLIALLGKINENLDQPDREPEPAHGQVNRNAFFPGVGGNVERKVPEDQVPLVTQPHASASASSSSIPADAKSYNSVENLA